MTYQPRPDHDAPLPSPATDEPRPESEKSEGLLAGPITGREQFVVEVQEHDQRSRSDAVKHRLGADQHGSVGKATLGPAVITTDLGHVQTGERGEVLTDPSDAGSDDPWPGRPAGGAHRRAPR